MRWILYYHCAIAKHKPNHKLVKRILIVDDNAVNRKYAKGLLKAPDLEITEVEDGARALEEFASQHFDMVLMDIQMPGMDGFECLKLIRENYPDKYCPILAVTAFSNDRERHEFTEAGFQSLIPKPIKPSDLKSEVKHWLSEGNEAEDLPVAETAKGNGLIDMDFYEGLKKHIRSDTLIDIYEEYERETKGFMSQLNFLVPAKNYPEILSILHTIKGNAGSLGIFTMADHTRQMEGALREGIYTNLEQDFDLLKVQFSNFVENYRRLLT